MRRNNRSIAGDGNEIATDRLLELFGLDQTTATGWQNASASSVSNRMSFLGWINQISFLGWMQGFGASDADRADGSAAGNLSADGTLSAEGTISDDAYISGGKWGPSGTVGTTGGTVTWSIAGAGLSYQPGTYTTAPFFTGTTVALSSFLPADYVTQITNAFAAWSAVSNINFVQVADGGGNFGVGTATNIRIGGGYIDGANNVAGRGFYAPANFGGGTANAFALDGDLVFDSSNSWTDQLLFGVALHEIGHTLGLTHVPQSTTAIMNPIVPMGVGLQAEDIANIQALYGARVTTVTQPDLTVSSITAAASVVQGSRLDLSYVVNNLGTAAAGAHSAGINVDAAVDDTHYVASNTVNALATGAQSTLTNSIDTSKLAVGQHTLYIKEDWHNGVGESNETNNSKSFTFTVTAPSRPARGDFNGDGTSDILFRNNANGAAWVAEIDQGALANWSSLGTSSTSYRTVGVGDFNGDGTSDFLVRNNANGDTWFGEMSDGSFAGWHQVGGSNTAYSVVGVGDFYGSGTSDFLVRNNATGDTWFGEMSDGNLAGWHQVGGSNTAYSVVGVGDFNGDATDDILFRNATGDTWFAQMNDGALQGWHQIGGSNTAYSVAGVGDFNGDATDDILFRNNATGDNWFAQMNDGALQGWHQIGGSNTAYAVAAVGDYDGNGTSDILFRNNASGDTWFAAMNNGALSGWNQVAGTDPSYSVIRT